MPLRERLCLHLPRASRSPHAPLGRGRPSCSPSVATAPSEPGLCSPTTTAAPRPSAHIRVPEKQLLTSEPGPRSSLSSGYLTVCYYSCYCLVAQSCLTLCNPVDCSMPGFPVLHQCLKFLKLTSIESMTPSNHLILCCPLLLPSISITAVTKWA